MVERGWSDTSSLMCSSFGLTRGTDGQTSPTRAAYSTDRLLDSITYLTQCVCPAKFLMCLSVVIISSDGVCLSVEHLSVFDAVCLSVEYLYRTPCVCPSTFHTIIGISTYRSSLSYRYRNDHDASKSSPKSKLTGPSQHHRHR